MLRVHVVAPRSVEQLPLMLRRDEDGNLAWGLVPQGAGGSTSIPNRLSRSMLNSVPAAPSTQKVATDATDNAKEGLAPVSIRLTKPSDWNWPLLTIQFRLVWD